MLWGIALPMMVVFCLGWAVMALQRFSFGQNSFCYGMSNGGLCFDFFGANILVPFCVSGVSCLAFFALVVILLGDFTLFALLITFLQIFVLCGLAVFITSFVMTRFTLTTIAVPCSCICIKFRKRFNLLAFRAAFGYDCLRHGFSPIKKNYCLEPFTAQSVYGSLYNIIKRGNVKSF